MAVRDIETEMLRVSIYRRMSGEEKTRIAARLYAQGVGIVRDSILAESPDIAPEELRERVRDRVLPRGLARQVRQARGARVAVAEGPMNQPDVFSEVLDALETLDIPYMVVGSFASSYWGRPRVTHDGDLLVELSPSAAIVLAERLGATFYAPADALREAAERHGHSNVIHLQEAFKVDLWVLQAEPYDLERFRRRASVPMLGRSVAISSAEDTILAKLHWYSVTPSDRQLQDALEVYEIQFPNLDQTYLDRWAEHLGVGDLLQRIRRDAALPPMDGCA